MKLFDKKKKTKQKLIKNKNIWVGKMKKKNINVVEIEKLKKKDKKNQF